MIVAPGKQSHEVDVARCGRSTSSGKLILCGEHGVIFGARALGMPILSRTMSLSVEPLGGQRSERKAREHHIAVNGGDLTQELFPTLKQALGLLGLQDTAALEVSVSTEIPLGAGLGASAALSVNMIRALAEMHGMEVSMDRLIECAHHLEKRFHGTPSGVDVHVITQNGLMSFQKHNGSSLLQAPQYFPLGLIDSGVRSSTKMMVSRSSQFFQNGTQLVADFNACHDDLVQAIAQKSYESLADALQQAGDLLHRVAVVGEVLEQVMQTLRSLGVRAVKPTGSGGAGYVLALLPLAQGERLELLRKIREVFGAHSLIEVWL